MSLKDLISTLIESAFTSKKVFIAQQPLPSYVYSTVDVPDAGNTGQNQQMICPCDGWARLGSKTGDANTIILNSSSVETTINLSASGWLCQAVPIRKGSTLYYRIRGTSGALQFIRSIGGGLNTIIQAIGGGLCHLSHSLNRFSSSLVAKQCRLIQMSNSNCQQAIQLQITPRPRTDMFVCERLIQLTQMLFKSKQQKIDCFRLFLSQVLCNSVEHICQSKRVKSSVFYFDIQARATAFCYLFRPLAQANLCLKGGAL